MNKKLFIIPIIFLLLWVVGTYLLLQNHDCLTFQGVCETSEQAIMSTQFMDIWFYSTSILTLGSSVCIFTIFLIEDNTNIKGIKKNA